MTGCGKLWAPPLLTKTMNFDLENLKWNYKGRERDG